MNFKKEKNEFYEGKRMNFQKNKVMDFKKKRIKNEVE